MLRCIVRERPSKSYVKDLVFARARHTIGFKSSPIKRASCGRTVTPDSYYRLEREMQTLRTENEIIRRSGFLLGIPLGEKIETIDRLKSDFSVYILCKTLGVLK